jgi:Zn-finger nucleic acid-binding protein
VSEHTTCPGCGLAGTLNDPGLNNPSVLQCSDCGGFWLGRAVFSATASDRELTDTLQALDSSTHSRDVGPVSYRSCPQCSEHMGRRQYGNAGVVIDICTAHGFWFDAGELKKVLAYQPVQKNARTAPLAAEIGTVNAKQPPLDFGDGYMDGNPGIRLKPFLRALMNGLRKL